MNDRSHKEVNRRINREQYEQKQEMTVLHEKNKKASTAGVGRL